MKELLVRTGAWVWFVAAGSAMAADMAVKPVYKAPVMAPIAFSWTGCYIGANAGGKWVSPSGSVNIVAPSPTSPFAFNDSSSDSGTFIGGGQLGCNWQTGSLVLGIEGDADWQKSSRTFTVGSVAVPGGFFPGDSFTISSTWQASVRGRIGYAWDRVLLYATGGIAWTDVTVDANFPPIGQLIQQLATDVVSEKKTIAGATLGGGLEYAVTNNLSFGIEGRYTWYDTHTFNTGVIDAPIIGVGFQTSTTSASVKLNTAEVIGKLNWKFTSH